MINEQKSKELQLFGPGKVNSGSNLRISLYNKGYYILERSVSVLNILLLYYLQCKTNG